MTSWPKASCFYVECWMSFKSDGLDHFNLDKEIVWT